MDHWSYLPHVCESLFSHEFPTLSTLGTFISCQNTLIQRAAQFWQDFSGHHSPRLMRKHVACASTSFVNLCGVSLAIMEQIIPTFGYLLQKKIEKFCLYIFSWKFLPRRKLRVQRLNHSIGTRKENTRQQPMDCLPPQP